MSIMKPHAVDQIQHFIALISNFPGASLPFGYGSCGVGLCGLLPVQTVLKKGDAFFQK